MNKGRASCIMNIVISYIMNYNTVYYRKGLFPKTHPHTRKIWNFYEIIRKIDGIGCGCPCGPTCGYACGRMNEKHISKETE